MHSWHVIERHHCLNGVAKKQEFLVVAHQKGERQCVRRLQRDSIASFERRESTNTRKNIPGIDKRLWKNPTDPPFRGKQEMLRTWHAIQERLEIVKHLSSYKASPVMEGYGSHKEYGFLNRTDLSILWFQRPLPMVLSRRARWTRVRLSWNCLSRVR